MAFPTSGLTNNQVHKEGNRAFVYDSALGVWDQVRETDRTENKFVSGTFPTGHVIQVVYVEDGDVATGTTVMPDDDTIPQITEGTEFMTLAITPASATNKLMIEVIFNILGSYAGENRAFASIFNTDFHATNALVTASAAVSHAYQLVTNPMRVYVVAGTTSATTFRFRAGSSSASTTTFNGRAGGRKSGGSLLSSITITEIQV